MTAVCARAFCLDAVLTTFFLPLYVVVVLSLLSIICKNLVIKIKVLFNALFTIVYIPHVYIVESLTSAGNVITTATTCWQWQLIQPCSIGRWVGDSIIQKHQSHAPQTSNYQHQHRQCTNYTHLGPPTSWDVIPE